MQAREYFTTQEHAEMALSCMGYQLKAFDPQYPPCYPYECCNGLCEADLRRNHLGYWIEERA